MIKKVSFLAAFCFSPLTHTCQDPQEEIEIHWDVNKTFIAMDAVQGKDLHQTMNGILAEFTFAEWNGGQKQSYYAFVTERLAKENPDLSQADEAFKTKRSELLKGFPDYLKQH